MAGDDRAKRLLSLSMLLRTNRELVNVVAPSLCDEEVVVVVVVVVEV